MTPVTGRPTTTSPATVSGDTTTVSGPLYFVEISGGSNINWIDFVGRGVTDNQRPDC